MSWFDLLKNIQISSQKTSSKDYVKPDEDDEDCFKYFYDLVKLMHSDFELKRIVHEESKSDDYWCRVKDSPWETMNITPAYEGELLEIGVGVVKASWAEIQIYYSNSFNSAYNPRKKIHFTMPEYTNIAASDTYQTFEIYETEDSVDLDLPNKYRRVKNIDEIWKKIKAYTEAK